MNTDVNMARVRAYGSAHRYFQGPGALGLVGGMCASLGAQPVLVADATVAQLVWEPLRSGCAGHGLQLEWVESSGDVTRALVRSLVETATASGGKPDVVIAAGGGKGVDTGKAVSRELSARLVVLPTSASNDGPCSESFVYYNERHEMESVEHLPRNPDAVIVDTQVLIKAPRALLVSGIGDALCKLYEGQQARAAKGLNLFGGRGTVAAQQLSLACERVIREHAAAGLRALDAGVPDAAFENLTEGLVLLAGLAFENSGLSIAHSMTRGLTLVPRIASQLHGQQVGYGLLVQFALERRDADFMAEQLRFHRSVGLATSLRELGGAEPDGAVIRRIAQGAMTAPHLQHFDRPLGVADFEEAMAAVEAFSRAHKG
ncbi:glycerol dehydrogenase [Diaphorobacter ruginosibacter]|uniref:glycerol dehydrogenase n=1 Tax=Diaphorobacter ruginosibacter TaxID=1715720 RepID=UPI0033427A4E